MHLEVAKLKSKSSQSMTIDLPITISTCYSPLWKAGPSISSYILPTTSRVDLIMCHPRVNCCRDTPTNANTTLYTLRPHVWTSRVIIPTVTLKPWEWTSSCHHQLFLRTSRHILNLIKNPSPYKCKPCSGLWSSLHLICKMLSIMSSINVLHEINYIYPHIIIHMCISSIWRDHIRLFDVPHSGPWSNLHHICNVPSLKSAIEQVYTCLIYPCAAHDLRSVNSHVSKSG